MKIAVDLVARCASTLLSRQLLPEARTLPSHGDKSGVIAASGDCLARAALDGGFLAVSGTPLPLIDATQVVDAASAVTLLPRYDGAFAAVYWSPNERKLVVVSDFLGFKPLYMRRVPGGLQLASDTKAWEIEADPAGWGAFVSFGHTIGDGTLLEGVERVHPGTVLVYDADSDRITERSYWRWPDPADEPDIGGLAEALHESVGLYGRYGDPGTLLLSGGYDSRLVACLLQRAQIPARALTVNHAEELGDADGRLAASFARRQHIPLKRVNSSSGFFVSEAYRDYSFETDAATPSLHLFIAQVAQFIHDFPVWEGIVPGCTLGTLHQPAGGFADYLTQECRSGDSPSWRDARMIFRADFAEAMYQQFQGLLRSELEKYPDTGQGVTQFVVRNRARNRTSINPLKVFESRGRAFLPGLTRNYFNLAGSLSYETRRDNRLYHELLQRHFSEALACPIVSGGVLIKTKRWSPAYYFNRFIGAASRWSAMYPSATRRLRSAFGASEKDPNLTWPNVVTLIAERDDYIDQGRVRVLAEKDALSPGARKLLFHWCAWRGVHRGTLHQVMDFSKHTSIGRYSALPHGINGSATRMH